MAQHLSTDLSTPTSPTPQKSFWGHLMPSRDGLKEKQSQQILIATVLLLVFISIGILTVFARPIDALITGVGDPIPSPGGILGLILIVLAFILLRLGYYYPSAILLIAAPYVAVVIAMLASDSTAGTTAYYFLTLSVVLASLLSTSRITIGTGVLGSLTILIVPNLLQTGGGFTIYWTEMMFVLLCTGMLTAGTALRDRYVHLLEETREKLENSVVVAEEARERAEQSDRVKSAFLASVSHELRTPLNSVINYTKFVTLGAMGPVTDKQVETLEKVIGSGKHLLQLINDVLDISKIESGSLKLFLEDDIDLNTILEDAISTGQSLIHDKPVEISLESEALPLIYADSQRLMQVMLNIISNACKFTDEGTITVSASHKDDAIEIAIADTGAGIEPENIKAVFEPFQQTDSGIRTGAGTGLGMPISKSLVEAHGGRIWFESTVNVGTTFYIQIPIETKFEQVSD